jgi:penicillin-binding protein A
MRVALPLAVGIALAVALDFAMSDSEPSMELDASVATAVPEAASNDMPRAALAAVPSEPAAVASPAVPAEPTVPAMPAAASTRLKGLEDNIGSILQQGKTPYASVVVLDVHTGAVLAIAEHSERGAAAGLALRPVAPAASVFKVVTSAALVEAGVRPSSEVCFHGGERRMQPSLLVNNARLDHTCMSLSDALSHSANVGMAKLAKQHLNQQQLLAAAQAFQFGAALPVRGALPSVANIPASGFGFAEAAAGFGDVKISTLHGAIMAAIVANDGVYLAPHDEEVSPTPERVLSNATASALQHMMADTVRSGTARKGFQQSPRLGTTAAGKTGSLTDYKSRLDTSWFIGFAPVEQPQVAVAAMVINEGVWHVKAVTVAKDAMRLAIKARKEKADDDLAARPADSLVAAVSPAPAP